MAKFCFVIHPLSFEDVVRYEPGAKGKGKPIIAKIMEWMPAWTAAHVTGIRTPDGRETEGWFVAAPLLPQQMLDFPRERVYERILKAIDLGVELGAQIAGLGAFTGVVGDGGVTIAERSPIPVTTGNSLTIAAGVRSLFRGANEMAIDAQHATAVVVGATGSIGGACVELIAPHVAHVILVARNETRLRKFHEDVRDRLAVYVVVHDRHRRCGAAGGPRADRDVVDAGRDRAGRLAHRRGRVRAVAPARRQPARRGGAARTCSSSKAATCACPAT